MSRQTPQHVVDKIEHMLRTTNGTCRQIAGIVGVSAVTVWKYRHKMKIRNKPFEITQTLLGHKNEPYHLGNEMSIGLAPVATVENLSPDELGILHKMEG